MAIISLLSFAIPVWWFWFADISLSTAIVTTIGCAGGWYSYRLWMTKDPEMMANVFARGLLVASAVGTVCGVSSILVRHLL